MKKRNEFLKSVIKLYDKIYDGTGIPVTIMMVLTTIGMITGGIKGYNVAVATKANILLIIWNIVKYAFIRMMLISIISIIVLVIIEIIMQNFKEKIKREEKK